MMHEVLFYKSVMDHLSYQDQLQGKIAKIKQDFEVYRPPSLEVFESQPSHYRMRAEFRMWHEGDDLNYVMFNQESKERYSVNEFPAASKVINALMPLVRDYVKVDLVLRKRLFQVEFLSSTQQEVLITLLYHRPLDDVWEAQCRELRNYLRAEGYHVDIIGRARNQKRVLDRDFVVEKFSLQGREIIYQQVENSFTQPNAGVALKMLEWVRECSLDVEGDLLELYCGNANFSIALAPCYRKVLATEVSKSSVYSAQWNIEKNHVTNLKVLRLSAEELTQAINRERSFRRLEQSGVELDQYDCKTVLVDPPRAGVDEETLRMLQQYQTIFYICLLYTSDAADD